MNNNVAIPISVDLATGAVTTPFSLPGGGEAGEESTAGLTPMASPADLLPAPILALKVGDRRPVDITLKLDDVVQDQVNVTAISMAIKEYEPELLYQLSEAYFIRKSDGSFRLILDLDADELLPVVAEYEEDEGTYLDALADIRITVTEDAVSSGTAVDLVQAVSHTFVAAYAPGAVQYTLPLNLPAQDGDYDVELDVLDIPQMTFTIEAVYDADTGRVVTPDYIVENGTHDMGTWDLSYAVVVRGAGGGSLEINLGADPAGVGEMLSGDITGTVTQSDGAEPVDQVYPITSQTFVVRLERNMQEVPSVAAGSGS